MNESEVTILVPIYNVEKYISKCLESLLKQTFSNIQIMAVNDGSTDDSGKIVESFCGKDKRINYIVKENGGYGSVLEYGIKHCKTKYLLICDPDDWIEENAIELLYNAAETNNLDVVIADKYLVYNDGEIVVDKVENKFYEMVPNKIYENNIEEWAFVAPSPHAKLYKVENIKNIKFPYKTSYTDLVLFCIALKNCKRIMYLNKPLAYYLLERPGNTRTDRKPKAVKDHITVWKSIFEQIDSSDKKIVFRLYKELKYITKVYYRNSESLFKDELFTEIQDIRKELLPYLGMIKKEFLKSFGDKIEYNMIFSSKTKLKLYILFRKLINK